MAEPRFIPGIAWLAIFLSGCGSTITTRIQSEPASPVPTAVLSHAQINRDVREMERAAGMRINPRESDAAVRELVRSSGTEPLSVSLERQSLRLNEPLIRQNPKDSIVRGSLSRLVRSRTKA